MSNTPCLFPKHAKAHPKRVLYSAGHPTWGLLIASRDQATWMGLAQLNTSYQYNPIVLKKRYNLTFLQAFASHMAVADTVIAMLVFPTLRGLMKRQPAKVLEEGDVRLLLQHVTSQRHGLRNTVIVLLSFKAGLRACEIAGLEWPMVLSSNGTMSDCLAIPSKIAKGPRGRSIPVHPAAKRALVKLHHQQAHPDTGPVILSERGGAMTPRSIVNFFATLYGQLGFLDCSSHSGRRTFITRSARILAKTGGSLRDIQELAGHRSLTTTERYIAGNREAQRRLINLL